MKRSKAARQDPTDAGTSSDEAEMDVDNVDEAKLEVDDDDEDADMVGNEDDEQKEEEEEEGEGEDGPTQAHPASERSEFLDAFYGLASSDPRERAVAGQVILYHTLLGPQANTTDAAYALKRLFNGLCSGRAAARQGNASCLASFLRISNGNGVLQDIRRERNEGEQEATSLLAYVRERLRTATSQQDSGSSGRRKAAEEKDNNFGRLFGVLAIVRSGILTPQTHTEKAKGGEMDDTLSICKAFLADLKDLYTFKPYMREPAAHAVCTLLNTFFRLAKNENESARAIVLKIVQDCVMPLFLETGDLVDGGDQKNRSQSSSPFATFSAEQIAIALNLQTNSGVLNIDSTQPALNELFFTEDTMSLISSTLVGTCGVNQPRTHLVWDAIWLYLTVSESSDNSAVDKRQLRSQIVGSDKSGTHGNPVDMLATIVNDVVVKKLLGGSADDDNAQSEAPSGRRLAHTRRALALTLIGTMAGIEFVSSLSGRTSLSLDADVLSSVIFQSHVVRNLFVNVISAGASGRQNQGDHTLKPKALGLLNQMIELPLKADKRLAICTALVRCEPQFDGRTRTATVHTLLGLNIATATRGDDESSATQENFTMWNSFVKFLQNRILQASDQGEDDDAVLVENSSSGVSTHEAAALIDIMFNLAKQVSRIGAKEGDDSSEAARAQKDRDSLLQEITSFLLAASFAGQLSDEKPKKKNRKRRKSAGKSVQIADRVSGLDTTIPFETRKVLSSRFFSLLTDSVNSASHASVSNRREIEMLNVMMYAINECKDLEEHGYSVFPAEIREEDDEGPTCAAIVFELLSNAQQAIDEISEAPSLRDRFEISVGVLVAYLHLCLLNCSDPSDDQDIAEIADHEEVEETRGFIEEVKDCADEILGRGDEEGKDEASNRLSSLIAMSINLLSSESSDGARGASSRLTRELVKIVLSAGLMFSAKSSDRATIDSNLADMIMQSIGVTIEEPDDEMEDDDDDESDADESDSQEQEGLFSKNAGASILDHDDDKMDDNQEMEEDNEKTNDEEEEMIDADRLNSMLEDSDIDVDESELEHHEGADKALAKLIKLKQEARKAGQAARERVELSQQLRCMLVLEIVLSGKPEGWGPLLRADVVMSMLPQMLERWARLEKASSKKGSDPATGERSALLARITSVVKAKLLKAKMSTMAWTESMNPDDHCQSIASKILEIAARRTSSKELQACCFHSLPALFRSLPSGSQAGSVLYSEAIEEWATKKTPIDARLLDELIKNNPTMAQSILVEPLLKAVPTAYSSFIKSECFRMISSLYNPNLNKAATDQEKATLDTMLNNRDTFVESAVIPTLQDEEMQKAKRLKEVLRCIEDVASFSSPHEALNRPISDKSVEALKVALKEVGEKTESEVAKCQCEALMSKLDNQQQNPQQHTTKSKQGKKKKKKNKKRR